MTIADVQAIHYSSKSEEWYTPATIVEAVILVAARPETKAFNVLADRSQRWCAIGKRLHFSGCRDSAQFPSAAFYFGENIKGFDLAFNGHGKIWVLADQVRQ